MRGVVAVVVDDEGERPASYYEVEWWAELEELRDLARAVLDPYGPADALDRLANTLRLQQEER